MSILAITSGLYSNEEEIIKKLSKKFNINVLTDTDIIQATHQTSNIKVSTLQKVVQSKPIAFNDFTHEKEKCLALLKQTLSDSTQKGDCIFHGFLTHLIPKEISHIMRILIITDKKNRITNGMEKNNLNENEATRNIEEADKYAALWTNSIFQKKAWDESLFDIVIPSDKIDSDESVALISKNLEKLLSNKEDLIKKELFDFKLIADIDVALTDIGTGLITEADNGHITVTIDKKVMMLSSFQQKIVKTVEGISGVKSVETKIGHNYYKGNIIRNYEFETPLRILLVDDEKEFVQTLSERLKMRQFTSEIAYNGQEALDFTEQEDTEVMILDLKMPGIDGFEVLKKIKQSKPDIEVIILTGHGTEADKKTCMDLGAFAYLQKPADIDLITDTMKKAYQKITVRKAQAAE